MLREHLALIAAPMVNQSDLPFRTLVRRHGATLAYTQMLMPDRILNDPEYFEHHLRDLSLDAELGNPVVVQLCGNDVDAIVQAGRKLQRFCDGIDLNLGCPQEAARDGHYGAYLLGQRDWPLVQDIVSGMAHSFTVPTSVKIRLCQPVEKTVDFAQRLEASGASWLTLHARTVSARRRRQGAADLGEVKRLKEALRIPVISNGNVRVWGDISQNLDFTGADGVMVGETLLGNPCLFANKLPDPVDIALEYLDLCRAFPGTAPVPVVQTHVRHVIEFQCGRRPWFQKFRAALGRAKSIEDVEKLLRTRVERWRGRPPRGLDIDITDEDCGYDSKANEDPLDDAMDLARMLG
ncbi:putative catalyzes the synthesis of dihydrouridine, a modified base found in the D-loop of most tRNAs [Lyophyllum shimeji]|uniref:tRNA-dihydrouridine(16/17) synthase [NAD(P)(+)] n=1 Tax=Lyophyllum shimeji TaxID=47721 RepID=A0A9P3PVF0_LYOSH|nr:putative catalyzes the synthesis of dihydrouridine, a modified base found in the D-loop of most tRNAs [Lyophyllum shimeji]